MITLIIYPFHVRKININENH